ncbi:MAG: putative peptidoglycan binding domain-containing protein, partial [Promethearchaeota archaeon]
MTLLSREDPSRLLTIKGELTIKIQNALVKLGLLEAAVEDSFSPVAQEALQEWINTNNFENKYRDDGTIWQSVLDYLLEDAETHG